MYRTALLLVLAAACAQAQRLSISEILTRMRSGGPSGRIVVGGQAQRFGAAQSSPVQRRDTLVFAVDDSASIGDHYSKLRDVINEMVRGESEPPDGATPMAMGVLKFGISAETVLWPTVYKRTVTNTVDRMPFGRQSRTNIVDGLEKAGDMLRRSAGHGSDVIVLLTDGHHNANGRDPVHTADALRRQSLLLCIIVVEIGIDTDAEKLDGISGCQPYHSDLVVKTSFAELGSDMAGVVAQLKDKLKQTQRC